MTHRRVRQAVLLVASVSLVGLWISLVGDDIDVGAAWLIGPCLLAGLLTSARVRLVGPHASGGPDVPRVHRQRSVAGDLALVAVGVLGAGLVLTFVAVARGEDDATIWFVALALALLGGGSAILGVLVGLLVVVPVITLVGLLARHRRSATTGADVLLCLLLPTITAFATLTATAVDSEGPSRSFVVRSLPALLAGADTEGTTVTSHPLFWAARAVLAMLVVELVLLVRVKRAEAR